MRLPGATYIGAYIKPSWSAEQSGIDSHVGDMRQRGEGEGKALQPGFIFMIREMGCRDTIQNAICPRGDMTQ